MINPKSVALVLFAVAFGLASLNVQADPGDTYSLDATFVDKASGNTYKFTINAREYLGEAGVGDVFFRLIGPIPFGPPPLSTPRLDLITVGKGWKDVPPDPENYHPLALIKASTPDWPAGHQAVDIGEKIVEISAHAFVHSDAPNIVFIGPVTVDLRVENRSEKIEVVIYSPKGNTKLQGKFTTP